MRTRGRIESFMAHRTAAGTYAGTGAAWRPLLFDAMQSDQSDGKVIFIPDSRFMFVAREREVWHFSLMAGLNTALLANETLYVGLFHSVLGYSQSSYTANQTTANYFPHVSMTLPFNPGDTMQPQLYSGATNGNNPHPICELTGARVG